MESVLHFTFAFAIAYTTAIFVTASGRDGATKLPAIMFGYMVAIGNLMLYGDPLLSAIALFAAWGAFELGHGNVYAMLGSRDGLPLSSQKTSKPERIELYGARWIYTKIFRGNIYNSAYSWWIMGIKGFLIGLFLFPYGVIFAFLYPLAYYLGMQKFRNDILAEWTAGEFIGFNIAVIYLRYVGAI